MISKLLFISYCFTAAFVLQTNAQERLLTGKIINAALEPLAYASVSIKELKTGTTSDNNGLFKFQLEAGKYDVVVAITGYKTQVLTITITKGYTLNIIMEAEKATMLGEVQVVGTKACVHIIS